MVTLYTECLLRSVMQSYPLTFLGLSLRRMYSLGDIPTMSAMYAVVVAISKFSVTSDILWKLVHILRPLDWMGESNSSLHSLDATLARPIPN